MRWILGIFLGAAGTTVVGGLVFGVMSLTAGSDEWQVELLDSAPGIALIQVTAPGGGATIQAVTPLTPDPLQALPAQGDPLSSSPSLAAESDEPGQVLLTWEDGQVSEEDPVSQYEVERSGTGNDGDWNRIGTVDADELRELWDWGLQPGELWHYRVRAGFNSSTYSDWSNSVATTVSGWPPQAPWPSAFSVGSDRVAVEWETHSDTPLLGHELEYSNDDGATYTTISDSLTADTFAYTHDAVSGESRLYRVRSCNSSGCGAWGIAGVVVGESVRPSAPAVKAVGSSDTAVDVSWSGSDGGEKGIDSYEVKCSANGEDWGYADGKSCSWTWADDVDNMTHSGLRGGTELHYRVRGHNKNGAGAWSVPVRAVTQQGKPDAIEDLEATPLTENSVRLTWSEPPGDSISEYIIRRAEPHVDHIPEYIASVYDDTTFTDNDLYSGSAYFYLVQAVNPAGTGPDSNWAYAATPGQSQYPPAGLTPRIDDITASSVTFGWDKPDDGGRPITVYRYYLLTRCGSDMSEVFDVEVNVERVTISGLSCSSDKEQSMEFRAYAVNEMGDGESWHIGLPAEVPNRGGFLNVSVDSLVVPEGGQGSYRLTLSKQPTTSVCIGLGTDGDSVITDQQPWWNYHCLNPDNWQDGVTIAFTAPEDEDGEDHVAVMHHAVWTHEFGCWVEDSQSWTGTCWGAATPVIPDPALEQSFHAISGKSVKVTFEDND